jgi:hypothetical protein
MDKKKWVIVAFLVVVFGGLLAYGIFTGDVDYVLKNAQNFCFS